MARSSLLKRYQTEGQTDQVWSVDPDVAVSSQEPVW